MDPCARRLPVAGRDAFEVTGREVQQEDLKERVVRFSLTLEDHLGSVAAEVTFAGATPLKRQLPRAADQTTLP